MKLKFLSGKFMPSPGRTPIITTENSIDFSFDMIEEERKIKRILLADDEPFNLKSLKVLLELALLEMGHPKDLLSDLIDLSQNGQESLHRV